MRSIQAEGEGTLTLPEGAVVELESGRAVIADGPADVRVEGTLRAWTPRWWRFVRWVGRLARSARARVGG